MPINQTLLLRLKVKWIAIAVRLGALLKESEEEAHKSLKNMYGGEDTE
jgi:hypothetical protein